MTRRGRMRNGIVVFEDTAAAPLPDGTLVEVTPVEVERPPHLVPVSQEQRDALLKLIGICKTDHPPGDEEVARIVDEERMRKYG